MAKKTNGYITLLANDSYIYCVIALYSSWLKTNSKYKFYCACTPEVSEEIRENLRQLDIGIIDLKPIDGLKALADKLIKSGYNSWVPALAKLAIYGLTQFNKFIFLDADTYIYKNLDHLFDKSHMTAVPDGASRPTAEYKFVPGDKYFQKFNAGMVVVEPSESLLNNIISFTKTLKVDRPWADQNIISEMYPDWVYDSSKHLPVYYNCLGRHICEYEKLLHTFKASEIYVLHLVGPKMSPTYGFDKYFTSTQHSTYCRLLVDICNNTNDFIKKQHEKGLLSNLSLVKNPPQIDLVVPYVDSSDAEWQKVFNKYNPLTTEVEAINAKNRFRGQGNFFRFFFRGIHQFMPWIHKIHLVVSSDSQVPSWIDRDKVHIVYHSDFIPEEYLPTFNSTAIEMFIWNIPELSEYFIYANDDMFVTKPLFMSDFFYEGKVNLYLKRFNIDREHSTLYGHHIHNGCRLIFGDKYTPYEPAHTIRGYIKSKMKECYNTHEEEIKKNISQFRTEDNFNMYIYDYYQFKSGLTCCHNVPPAESCYLKPNNLMEIQSKLSNHKFSILCVQDTSSENDIYSQPVLVNWFKKLCQNHSQYEIWSLSILTEEQRKRIESIASKFPGSTKDTILNSLMNQYLF